MDDILVKHDMEKLPTILIGVSVAILIQAITSFLLTQILSVEAQHLISVLRSRVQKHLLPITHSLLRQSKDRHRQKNEQCHQRTDD